jgi:hypothetical protein
MVGSICAPTCGTCRHKSLNLRILQSFGYGVARCPLAHENRSCLRGFRNSTKDYARTLPHCLDEASELALDQVSTDATRAAYARSELIDRQRELMQEWADSLGEE